ncbi:MAG: tetratricopeptide repeat protein [Pseudomonadota bacterium]|nr:tetratricopeptide repeat protein [Pseudomonadota bacterium]
MELAKLILITGALFFTACSTFDSDDSKGNYKSSALDFSNSGRPSSPEQWNSSEEDPLNRRSLADYHFTLAESYSHESQPEKAIEEYKHTLVYDKDSGTVHFRLAKEYVRVGLVSEAIEQAEESVRLAPTMPEQRFLLGALYSSMKMFDKASAQYQEVLKTDPENADAQLYVGALLAEEGKFDEAVTYFEHLSANKKFTSPFLAWYYIGRIRIQQNTDKSYQQAEKALIKGLQIKPDFSDAAVVLAGVYEHQEKIEKAVELLASFQDKHGPSTSVAEALAPFYLKQEKYELAYQQYEISSQSDPDDLNVMLKMAHLLYSMKKYDEAISQLENLLNRAPDSDRVRYFLGAVYLEKGSLEFAAKAFLQIGPTSQYYFQSIVLAAHTYKQMNQMEKAIATLAEGLTYRKDIPQLYTSMASLLSENKRYSEAIEIVQDSIEKFPENAEMRFVLGSIYDKIGKSEKTVEQMIKVLEINPDHAQALNYIAYTYAEQNSKLDEAEKLIRKALTLEPKDGYIMDTLGWILFKQDKIVESIQTLEKAYEVKNDESIIAEHLGDAYYKNQMPQKAQKMYRRALELEKDEQILLKLRSKITATEDHPIKSQPRNPASSKPAKK